MVWTNQNFAINVRYNDWLINHMNLVLHSFVPLSFDWNIFDLKGICVNSWYILRIQPLMDLPPQAAPLAAKISHALSFFIAKNEYCFEILDSILLNLWDSLLETTGSVTSPGRKWFRNWKLYSSQGVNCRIEFVAWDYRVERTVSEDNVSHTPRVICLERIKFSIMV